VTRVVQVAAMNIFSPNIDDRLFVKLGSIQNGQIFATCELPGTKVKAGERLQDALHRFIFTELPHAFRQNGILESAVGPETDILMQKSKKHLISSSYVRRTVSLTINWDQTGPVCARRHTRRTFRSLARFGTFLFEKQTSHTRSQTLFESLTIYPVWDETAEHVYLYAWVTEEEFRVLKASRASGALQGWLSNLSVPSRDSMIEADSSSGDSMIEFDNVCPAEEPIRCI